ncbi:MAG: ATP-dependent DNA ligase [Candidatus Diapherotrites archaeon]|nr:ATP-dependent DNA ligase [Candidatus Diapherotrites archaeon]
MLFSELVRHFERLDKTTKRLEMADIVAEVFKDAASDLPYVVLFSEGRVFPAWDRRELRIAEKMMVKCISTATGYAQKRVDSSIAETGDTGITAQRLLAERKQQILYRRELSIKEIYDLLEKISFMEGAGSADRKNKHVIELLNFSTPAEAKYLVRLMLGEMRLGVGEGIVRDAIAKAFDADASLVERAYSFVNDFSEVAVVARDSGDAGLKRIQVRVGRPLKPMLAQSVRSVEEALSSFKPAFFESKYDGMRSQIHVKNGRAMVFTRRLDDVTKQFPDIVEAVSKHVKCRDCIIEGESVAVDKDGSPRPFQVLSRRIKRKYDIGEMVIKIPMILYLFDCLYLNGENFLDAPLKNRREALKKVLSEAGNIHLSEALFTSDAGQAKAFYEKALDEGHEGVMIKNPDSPYKAGSRVGTWYKLKPTTETLDLVIVGADWGEGRRAKWLGSFYLACRDPDTNEFLAIGKMATGLTDELLKELTEMLKEDVLEQQGKFVRLRPRLVVEAGYQEIQKSPTYESGYALRFPRLIRLREDRAPEECDDVTRVDSLYSLAHKKK